MFPKGYFAPTYFAPLYWPPSGDFEPPEPVSGIFNYPMYRRARR